MLCPMSQRPADPGLCASCAHARTVCGARASFWRCGRSDRDPSFPRYPRLPVLRCRGYEVREGGNPESAQPGGGTGSPAARANDQTL